MPGNPILKRKEDRYNSQFLEDKGSIERKQMEQMANRQFSIHYINIFFERKHQGFIVNLKIPMTEDEIQKRMLKGFGDLNNGHIQ